MKTPLKNQQKGAILLEGLIAIVIFSMGILALAGLQAAMTRNTTDSNYRAEATYIAQKTVSSLWANPDDLAALPLEDEDGTDVDTLPNGKLFVERPEANEQVRVRVSWQHDGDDPHQVITNARVTGDI
jgi:type IV pilus assembly protein PilV